MPIIELELIFVVYFLFQHFIQHKKRNQPVAVFLHNFYTKRCWWLWSLPFMTACQLRIKIALFCCSTAMKNFKTSLVRFFIAVKLEIYSIGVLQLACRIRSTYIETRSVSCLLAFFCCFNIISPRPFSCTHSFWYSFSCYVSSFALVAPSLSRLHYFSIFGHF